MASTWKDTVINKNFSVTAVADFRDAAQFIHNGLIASGWLEVADTGNANLTTMTVQGGTNFKIYKMNDALAATYPVFIKLEYNPTSSSGTAISFYLTVGTGSNGSGTLTNIIFPRTQMNGNSSVTSGNYKHAGSGDPNRTNFIFSFQTVSSASYILFGIQRTKNADRTDSNVGVYVVTGGAATCLNGVCPFTGSIPPTENNLNICIPSSGSTLDVSDLSFFESRMFYFGKNVAQQDMFLGYRTTDTVPESVVSVAETVGGSPVTTDYLLCNNTQMQGSLFNPNRNNNQIAMRY